MRITFSFPGVMEHAQHAALSLHEAGALEAFDTAFVFDEGSVLDHVIAALPRTLRERLRTELRRRTIQHVPPDRVRPYGGWEMLRTAAAKAGLGPRWVDRVWDVSVHRFDHHVAQGLGAKTDAVEAFEYAALASFERARELGKARILQLPSLESGAFHALETRERAEWPELRGPDDDYFAATIARRQVRRRAEIALAEVMIANSSLTKRSFVAAGAPAEKIWVVPLGAPPTIAEATPGSDPRGPLKAIWSGSFILRKGAHYLLDAWRALGAGPSAQLDIYGEVGVPQPLIATPPGGVTLHGSIPREQMLRTYADADVLVFPTLSDGFGMAVTEALSRGVPVITTDQAGAADLIEHGRNGLIVPASDAQALAQALQWCLDNRPALAAMRAEALASARQRQWSDFRRDHILALDQGLRQAGYAPSFDMRAR